MIIQYCLLELPNKFLKYVGLGDFQNPAEPAGYMYDTYAVKYVKTFKSLELVTRVKCCSLEISSFFNEANAFW